MAVDAVSDVKVEIMGKITVERQLEIALAVLDANEFLQARWGLKTLPRWVVGNDRWIK